MIKNSSHIGNEGFALVLSIILLLAMSLIGGALIAISSGDHKANNASADYQQTFYVAEAGLLEGEKYVINTSLKINKSANIKLLKVLLTK